MNPHRITGCAAAILLSACAVRAPEASGAPGMDAPAGELAFVPRQRELSGDDQRRVATREYDPVDLPLAFTPGGDLVVAHTERYVVSDTPWEVCAGSGFYLVSRNGGPARPLVTGPRVCRTLRTATASSNGAWVVYEPNPPRTGVDFVRLELATGRMDTLRTGSGVDLDSPALSADGRMIAAVGRERDDPDTRSLYVMNSDGSGLRKLAASGASPLWSPDGRRLAYHRGGGRDLEVVVMDVDGTDARAVGTGDLLAWSPDGEWLAVLQRSTTIQIVRPDGTGRRTLFTSRPRRAFPGSRASRTIRFPEWRAAWSPDSRWLTFSRMGDVGTSVWRIEAATRRMGRVTRPDS